MDSHEGEGVYSQPKLLRLPEGSPPCLVKLVHTCVDRNPKKRPQFSEIETALRDMKACLDEGYQQLQRPDGVPRPSVATLELPAAPSGEPPLVPYEDIKAKSEVPRHESRVAAVCVLPPSISQEALVSVRGLKSRQMRHNRQHSGRQDSGGMLDDETEANMLQ